MIRVLLVDDHRLVRASLRSLTMPVESRLMLSAADVPASLVRRADAAADARGGTFPDSAVDEVAFVAASPPPPAPGDTRPSPEDIARASFADGEAGLAAGSSSTSADGAASESAGK